ncbi:MerR family transcriptional regulator [Bifidobacterium cebidarum]|uniref:Helix-turn-helix domain-containing protein n=1 Tax=Bifidobacterium cebidarum TaxID=2650773 RepID=A0A6I1GIL2_9BIFI|nr:hypothetical protein [Bifidobacterium cebidarum]KAB7786980.1 hypothetical protein F7D08_1576 [Bifidobacterium cebidarum]
MANRTYTLNEVSEMSGISQAALAKRIGRGRLPATKDASGRWIVDEETYRKLEKKQVNKSLLEEAMSRKLEDESDTADATGELGVLQQRLKLKQFEIEHKHEEIAAIEEQVALLKELIAAKKKLMSL